MPAAATGPADRAFARGGDAFVAAGCNGARHDLMYNDFIVVGPDHNPPGSRRPNPSTMPFATSPCTAPALPPAATKRHPQRAGAGDPSAWCRRPDGWCPKRVAAWGDPELRGPVNGYALADRATWLAANKFTHRILFEGDPLFNQYGIVTLDPAHCPSANHVAAARFADWLLAPRGQSLIGGLRRQGQQLFVPNATSGTSTSP